MAENTYSIYDFIDDIRPSAPMYIGILSIGRLDALIRGYMLASDKWVGRDIAKPPFSEFYTYVQARLGLRPTATVWAYSILEACGGDEEKAFKRFYELLDEYRSGQFSDIVEQWEAEWEAIWEAEWAAEEEQEARDKDV